MSSARPQLAPAVPEGRSPLAHLLHALNQPLTGLQCSMELTLAGPRPADHYIRTLREGLDLVSRMRTLVEALRDLTDLPVSSRPSESVCPLDRLLYETAAELAPVAEAREIRLSIIAPAMDPVRADQGQLSTLLFRFLDSALSLAREKSELQIAAASDHGAASVNVSWMEGPLPENSPFSGPELGLLITRAAAERLGGSLTQTITGKRQTCLLQIPWTHSHRPRTSKGERPR